MKWLEGDKLAVNLVELREGQASSDVTVRSRDAGGPAVSASARGPIPQMAVE